MTGATAILVAIITAAGSVIAAGIGVGIFRGVKRNREITEVAATAIETAIDTGNGSPIGPTVHRIETTLEAVASAQRLQTDTLVSHGRTLGELHDSNRQHGDRLNDHLIESAEVWRVVQERLDEAARFHKKLESDRQQRETA